MVCRETNVAKGPGVTVDHLGQRVGVTSGFQTEGGIILLDDKLGTSPNSHEMEVVASATADLQPNDRVVVYLGGDDGDVSSAGISAFLPFNGEECAIVPERYLWATVRDGEIIPRRDVVLVERDDAAMQRYAFNSSPIHVPTGQLGVDLMRHGVAAANREDPGAGGARTRDSVTLQYARVVRAGPDVGVLTAEKQLANIKWMLDEWSGDEDNIYAMRDLLSALQEALRFPVRDTELDRGAIVAFSPSLMCTTLVRRIRLRSGEFETKYYALVSAGEVFFAVGE